jgi:hypothetical protein
MRDRISFLSIFLKTGNVDDYVFIKLTRPINTFPHVSRIDVEGQLYLADFYLAGNYYWSVD